MIRGRLLVACAVLACASAAVAITFRSVEASRNDAVQQQNAVAVCVAVNRLNDVIVGLLERSQKALPSNPFYKEHPELLADALRQNAQALVEFRRAACLPKGATP